MLALGKYIKHLTIEPVFFFHYTTYIVLDLVNTNLYLQKACRINATTEPDLMSTPCDNEKQGILFASRINSNYRYVMFTVCILFTIFATCWSDESGRRRRPLVFLPIIGQILQSINGCVHSHFWYWTPMAAAISDMVFEMSVGGVIMMIMIAQIYICDISNAENRTMRLGLLWGVKTLCMLVGNGSAGFLIRTIGFFYSYMLCGVLSAIALGLAVALIKDVSVPAESTSFLQLIHPARIVCSFQVVFKKSLGSKRTLVLLLLILYVLVYFTFQGEKTVFYLFLRYKFQWDEERYSLYLVYRNIGVISGTVFCSFVLSKRLQVHDALIGAFAGIWDIVATVGYLFASQNWHLYIVPLFDIFHGTALSVSVSFLSKFYEGNEFGRLNAVLNFFSLAIPFSHPAYNIVFQKTIDYFPSAFFLISLFVNVAVLLLYYTSYALCRKASPFSSQ